MTETIASTLRDGQAEFAWVAGYIPRWYTRPKTVTPPSTNRAQQSNVLDTPNAVSATPNRHNVHTQSKYLLVYIASPLFIKHAQHNVLFFETSTLKHKNNNIYFITE